MRQYINKQFNENRCIICLGEDARYDFAKELMSYASGLQIIKEDLRQKMLFIHHKSEVFNEEDKEREEVHYLTSSLIPYKSMVQIPGNNRINKEQINHKLHTKIYIFEQYPYGKDTTRSLLSECQDQYPWAEVKVILWQEERRFGATDVSDEMVALRMAQQKFEQMLPNCTIIKNDLAFKALFYTQFQYTLQLGKEYEASIDQLKQDMVGIFEDYYYFEVESLLEEELLNLQRLDKYCKYEAIKNVEDLWQGFCYSFQKDTLKKDGIIHQTIFSLYEKMINDVCFWNIQEDAEALKKEIDQYFYKNVVIKKPKTKILKRPKGEMEYRIQMAKEPLDVRFKEKIQTFIKEDLKKCIQQYIDSKIKDIES